MEEENLPFPLSALTPDAWAPDASYFDQANPILRTNTLGPAVAQAEMIDRLHLGGPVFQQMEHPTPEALLLDDSPGGVLGSPFSATVHAMDFMYCRAICISHHQAVSS